MQVQNFGHLISEENRSNNKLIEVAEVAKDIFAKERKEEEIGTEDTDKEDERSVTVNFMLKTAVCGALDSPGATALVVSWTPILLFCLGTGGLVTEVELLGREDLEVASLDIGEEDYDDQFVFFRL